MHFLSACESEGVHLTGYIVLYKMVQCKNFDLAVLFTARGAAEWICTWNLLCCHDVGMCTSVAVEVGGGRVSSNSSRALLYQMVASST